jgi:hypothetical protein
VSEVPPAPSQGPGAGTDQQAASDDQAGDALKLRFGGSLVEQLGAQLYPSLTATVAELISNAWDADATHLWITIPFGDSWRPESQVLVIDDGIGMTRKDARTAYLVVGRKRRLEEGTDRSAGGRRVHGRKGIGKLAAFGTAAILECITIRTGERTAFRLDYDEIRKLRPDQDYVVRPVEQDVPLLNPETSEELQHGTRVRLTKLHLKKALNQDQFMRSMSRRFAINKSDMLVKINGKELDRFQIPVQIRFPRDGKPSDDIEVDAKNEWAREVLPIAGGEEVRWWFGFTEKPLAEDLQQGVSVLTRHKMAQRPFRFEKAQGTTGQLGQEYLVGEVEAEWLDEGLDIEDDLIQSNRDQLQLEDARLEPFLEWGRKRLRWALAKRNELRRDLTLEAFEAGPELDELLQPFTVNEKRSLRRVAQIVSNLPEVDPDGVVGVMRGVVDARDDVVVRSLMERIEEEEDPIQERMWALVSEFGLIDARRLLSLIQARIATIERLEEAIKSGAREVPDLHRIVQTDAWLLDPRWHLLDDEVDVTTLDVDFEPETEAETGNQLDFLFVLTPGAPAPLDEAVVVEIKRGTYKDGRVRKANRDEVQKFHGYVLAVQEHFRTSSDRPTIRGLMIAQGYSPQAELIRANLEEVPVPRMRFRTWDRVIDETKRLHLGWLNVSRRRVGGL